MMLVSSRWMMLALVGALVLGCNEATGPLSLPAAVGRPATASQGPRVGVIVAQGGGVTIVPRTGQPYPGGPDQQLLRDDSLVTAADSFVVVQLHNGHLVRLGASQRNVVEMLAPFHDPPADDDVEARFVRLLSSEERDDPAMRGAITRVAGWNTRMSAAQTFAALPPSAAPVRVDEAPPPAPPPPPPPAPKLPSEASTAEESKVDLDDTPLDGLGGSAAKPKTERSDTKRGRPPPKSGPVSPPESQTESNTRPADEAPGSSPPVPVPGSPANRSPAKKEAPAESDQGQPPALPKQLRFTPAGGGKVQMLDLPTPLKGAADLATCAGAGAKITGRVKDHKLVALAVNGAVKCQALVGKASTLADGSFELTVTP